METTRTRGFIERPTPAEPPAPPPLLNPENLAALAALRVRVEAWVTEGKAIMDRMVDLTHDARRT
jgi:hypothetical protein